MPWVLDISSEQKCLKINISGLAGTGLFFFQKIISLKAYMFTKYNDRFGNFNIFFSSSAQHVSKHFLLTPLAKAFFLKDRYVKIDEQKICLEFNNKLVKQMCIHNYPNFHQYEKFYYFSIPKIHLWWAENLLRQFHMTFDIYFV